MKKMINNVSLEGYVYENKLVKKTVSNEKSANYGTEFISGEIGLAVDEEGLNVVPVHFTYVTAMTKAGKKNTTYEVLEKIIEEEKTWINVGKDACAKIRVSAALSLNEFYNQQNELVSAKVNEGSFVSLITKFSDDDKKRNRFEADMIITKATRKEGNEETNTAERVEISGVVFNFRNAILPMSFSVMDPQGMDWFEGLDASASNPVFTKVWGNIICETKVTKVTEETAFGEAAVKTFERKSKTWAVTGTMKVPYDFDDEATITADELKTAMQDRELVVADIKRRNDEYQASKNAGTTKAATSAPVTAAPGAFVF